MPREDMCLKPACANVEVGVLGVYSPRVTRCKNGASSDRWAGAFPTSITTATSPPASSSWRSTSTTDQSGIPTARASTAPLTRGAVPRCTGKYSGAPPLAPYEFLPQQMAPSSEWSGPPSRRGLRTRALRPVDSPPPIPSRDTLSTVSPAGGYPPSRPPVAKRSARAAGRPSSTWSRRCSTGARSPTTSTDGCSRPTRR